MVKLLHKNTKLTRSKRVWKWKRSGAGMRYAEEMIEIPLTEKELRQIYRELKALKQLKKFLGTSMVKKMFSDIPLSNGLILYEGKLGYWHEESYWFEDRCVMPSDCDGNHQSRWVSEKRWARIEPSLEVVQRFNVSAEKIKEAERKLRVGTKISSISKRGRT